MGRLAPLLVACLLAAPVAARETQGPPPGPTPAKNFSHIHADVEWVSKAFATAGNAARNGDWANAARSLQAVIDARASRESPDDAAPYVRAVHGTAVYEGAWIVARHMLAAWGEPALERYGQEYGAMAREGLARAAARRDESLLAEVARRFLCLPAGRRAALLLIDLALERSDLDVAIQWIQALEDLEAVSDEAPETLAPWRAARIERHAQAVAKDARAHPVVLAALREADPAKALQQDLDPVKAAERREQVELRRGPTTPQAWLTTGGNAARSALPAALGSRFRLKWFRQLVDEDEIEESVDPAAERQDRPSPWLPPRAVATREQVFVSDGRALRVFDVDDGRPLVGPAAGRFPSAEAPSILAEAEQDRRKRWGLLEGHALTLHPVRDFQALVEGERRRFAGEGHLVLAAVPDGEPWPVESVPARFEFGRDDHLQAFHWDPLRGRLEPLWRAGGRAGRGGFPDDTRLYGAPIVYRGRVWVAGVRPAQATPDRWEAWVFSLEPASGRVLTRTHVGTGTPVRSGRVDEVVPSSPAAAYGRVVVSTALGILAALDAEDGRVLWIYRYDRAVETERGHRRNRDSREEGSRTTSFFNEPPILALDRCYVAPTDSDKLLVVFDRPRSRARSIESLALDQMMAVSLFLVEQVAGVAPRRGADPARLVLVGKGESGSPPGPLAAALDAIDLPEPGWPADAERAALRGPLWTEHSPTGFGPYPYGRALVTREEAFVPTRKGIAVFELHDRDGNGTHYLGVLNRKDIPEPEEAPSAPYGNLIPVPGRGLVAVNATTVAFWERRP